MPHIVSFNVRDDERGTIGLCARRAVNLLPRDVKRRHDDGDLWRDFCMDLAATHANGMPLDLEKLLAFPDFDFSHDVFGIREHLDRSTGQLLHCFVPRSAKPRTV